MSTPALPPPGLPENRSRVRGSGKHTAWRRFRATNLLPESLVLLYDGSLEGLFTCIFRAFERRIRVLAMAQLDGYQERLLSRTESIATRVDLAERVRSSIAGSFGIGEYERIRTASLSDDPDKGTIIFEYLVYAFDHGPGCWHDLGVDAVADFERLWTSVYNERHAMLQFTRFAKAPNGVYFAKINPKADVVPLIMGHFSARFNMQPFIIYDEVHHIAGIWDQQVASFVRTDSMDLPALDEGERDLQHMWKTFYDHICNSRRYNPALRMKFMPRRLWANITEMDPRLAVQSSERTSPRRGDDYRIPPDSPPPERVTGSVGVYLSRTEIDDSSKENRCSSEA